MNHPAVDNCLRLATEKQALEKKVKELKSKVRKLQAENRRRLKILHTVADELGKLRIKGEVLYVSGNGVICRSHPADGC